MTARRAIRHTLTPDTRPKRSGETEAPHGAGDDARVSAVRSGRIVRRMGLRRPMVTCRMDVELIERLQAVAALADMTVSDIVRAAVSMSLDRRMRGGEADGGSS